MRKILTFPIAVFAAVRCASIAASFAAATLCCFGFASAQSPQPFGQSLMSYGENPIQSGQRFSEVPFAGEASMVQREDSSVELASFLRQPARQRGGRVGNAAVRPSDPCNVGCDVSWYGNYDALWLKRENDERFSLSRNSFMPDFDYDFGGRYTVGRLLDCVNGWEAVYAGPFDWQRSATVTGTANLQSNLQPLGGYTAATINTFNGADVHSQLYRAQLNSFELNRRWWAWDVLSTMIGIRYIDYEEDFLFASSDLVDGNGLLVESVDNQMLGAQFGGDLLYPVSLRSNVGIRGKAGVYANFDERTTFLSNAGTVVLNAGENDVDVAGLIEMGVFGNYQIVPSIRLTAGYEFWYLPGMATIPEQGPSLISPSSGASVSDSADLFLHGGSVGAQILF